MNWMIGHKNQKGAAAVEFAIVLPVLAVILFGTIDFALLFYNKQVLTNAAREGARSAIVAENREADPTLAAQISIIQSYCAGRLINLGGGNELETTPTITLSGNRITATVTWDYDHLFSSIVGIGSTTLTARTVMRIE